MNLTNGLCILFVVCLVVVTICVVMVRDDRIVNLGRSLDWLNACNQDLQRMLATKDAQIGHHMRDGLIAEHERLHGPLPDLDAQAVVADAVALIDAEWEARGVA